MEAARGENYGVAVFLGILCVIALAGLVVGYSIIN
jgi:hypothetical protein